MCPDRCRQPSVPGVHGESRLQPVELPAIAVGQLLGDEIAACGGELPGIPAVPKGRVPSGMSGHGGENPIKVLSCDNSCDNSWLTGRIHGHSRSLTVGQWKGARPTDRYAVGLRPTLTPTPILACAPLAKTGQTRGHQGLDTVPPLQGWPAVSVAAKGGVEPPTFRFQLATGQTREARTEHFRTIPCTSKARGM